MERDTCVVVPTVRDDEAVECLEAYVENARRHGFDRERLFVLLVTEEFCDVDGMRAALADAGVAGAVVDGPAREAWFANRDVEEYADLIPEASHAQTSFGLLYLWAEGYDYGVFIDDDTRPHPDVDFFGRHHENLAREGRVRELSSDERWVNVLDEADASLYPRGYPYGAMGETTTEREARVDRVVASQGLWTDVPDLDAVRVLMDGGLDGRARTRTTAADYGDDFVVAPGDYLTVCSMNLAFRREVVPAFYQLPMDDNPWGVGRFDDIWSGVVLKRAADLVGDAVLSGDPLCEHRKAPRPTFDDLAAEAPGLELNEHLWRVVDDVSPAVEGTGAGAYATVAAAVADRLATGDFSEWRNGAFLNHCGELTREWLDCLAALDDGATGASGTTERTVTEPDRQV
jgi:hypothetical protein